MNKIDELRKQEEELEQERMMYLEADNNRIARKKEKELYKVREKIEVVQLEEKINIKKQLIIYKDYIKKLGLEEKFNSFYAEKIAKEED